jgi:hypothetical protein
MNAGLQYWLPGIVFRWHNSNTEKKQIGPQARLHKCLHYVAVQDKNICKYMLVLLVVSIVALVLLKNKYKTCTTKWVNVVSSPKVQYI